MQNSLALQRLWVGVNPETVAMKTQMTSVKTSDSYYGSVVPPDERLIYNFYQDEVRPLA